MCLKVEKSEIWVERADQKQINNLPLARQFALMTVKLQLFGSKTRDAWHVWHPIRTCLFVSCPRLDATDGRLSSNHETDYEYDFSKQVQVVLLPHYILVRQFFFFAGGGGVKKKKKQNRTGKQANQGHIINWKPSEKNVNGAFHLVSHMLNPFCSTTIWILCYENGERENSEWEQNLN